MHLARAAPYSELRVMIPALGRAEMERRVENADRAEHVNAELPD
jgi:hypothetical protein